MKHDTTSDLTATIEAKEGRIYRLKFSDGQELLVPIHHLSKHSHTGDVVYLKLMNEQEAKSDKNELARHLLEEILNGEE